MWCLWRYCKQSVNYPSIWWDLLKILVPMWHLFCGWFLCHLPGAHRNITGASILYRLLWRGSIFSIAICHCPYAHIPSYIWCMFYSIVHYLSCWSSSHMSSFLLSASFSFLLFRGFFFPGLFPFLVLRNSQYLRSRYIVLLPWLRCLDMCCFMKNKFSIAPFILCWVCLWHLISVVGVVLLGASEPLQAASGT
jgi:hypothetical protein